MGKRQTDPRIRAITTLFQSLKGVGIILSVLCLIALSLSCKGSGPASADSRFKHGNVLRYDVNAPIDHFNPSTTNASGSTFIFPLMYSYLFIPNSQGELEPDLAESWSYDPEKRVWTIRLRDDARFHDNRPVTAGDVRYSLEKFITGLLPALGSGIRQISVLSNTTLCIHLQNEDPFILDKIWFFEIFPEPDGKPIDFYRHPIGSGPFQFKSRHRDSEVSLKANDHYYAGRPLVDHIVFRHQPDREKAWARLLSGKTDIAQEISPTNDRIMRKYEDRFYFDRYILSFYTILLYNTRDPLFCDPGVRRALALGIDRDYIVKHILKGYGRLASGPMGVDSPFHNPGVTPLPFNPRRALSLLTAAGWSRDPETRRLHREGKPFEFTLLVFKESQIDKKVARYIQLCLNELGIRVRLQSLRFEALQKRWYKNTRFQAVITELQGAYRYPEYLMSYWMPGSWGPSDAGCFEHPEVSRLMKTCLETTDPKKKKVLYYEIDAQIACLQPGTFLFQKTAVDLMSKRFELSHPFSLDHQGIHRLRHAVLKDK